MANKGICYGVSVGPGSEEQITLEALNVIRTCDVIFLPSAPKEECKAYLILKQMIDDLDDKDVRCVGEGSGKESKIFDSKHDMIFAEVSALLDEGKNVAFPALGEVAIYSTYYYVHEKLLAAGYDSQMVSGISSIQAIAAKLGMQLAIGTEKMTLFPQVDDLEAALRTPGTLVFMKLRKDRDAMLATIRDYVNAHPGMTAGGVSNCGMPGEIVAKTADEIVNLQGYFTVLIVHTGDVLEQESLEPGSDFFENRACKYYPCHDLEHINCLMCYCPMYRFEKCLGRPEWKVYEDGSKLKICTNCSVPHRRENYQKVMDFLKAQK